MGEVQILEFEFDFFRKKIKEILDRAKGGAAIKIKTTNGDLYVINEKLFKELIDESGSEIKD